MDIPLIKRQLITYIVPGLAYFVIAKLSILLLAIEPSEATAVWPAAGVSVSAIILLGFRAWFGLLTGILAFYGHLWLDVSSLKTLANSVTLILLLSSATLLHALAAVFLCHRLLGNNIDLIDDGKIVIFLFIIGPFVASLTSLISVGTFRLFDIIDPSEFFIGWLTWWTGDSIGAMLTTPILLTFFSTQTNALYSRRISAGLPMAAMLLAIFALFLVAKDFREQEQRQRFVGQVEQLHSHIKNRIDASIEVLFSIRSFFNSSNLISRNDFSNFSRRKLERYPEIKALEWIPHIHDQFRDQFEALTEGPGHISQLDSSGNLIIASQRNHYYPVMYLEPLEGNQRAFGFDVSSNLKAAEFQQQALLSNEIVLTAPIRLIQEHGNQLGVAAYLAVAHRRVDSGMSDEGFIAGIYRFGDFLASVLAQREDLSRAINLKVLDITQSSVVMYQDKTAQKQHNNPLHWHTDHAAGGRIYRFEYSATKYFFSNIYQWYSWGVLLAGVLFSGLLSCWLLSLTATKFTNHPAGQ